MSKGFQPFYNIFSKNKSKLETDAVPTSEESDQSDPINTNSSLFSIPPDSEGGLEVINRAPSESSVELFNPIPNPATNNLLAVNHTQGQVVNQFSHIKSLHLGSKFVFNGGGGTAPNGSGAPQKQQKTRTVDVMMRSQDKLPLWMVQVISEQLGEGWKFVVRNLGYSDAQIHHFKHDNIHDGGLQEIIYQILLDWTRNDDNPTLGKITTVLWNLEHYETVKIMKMAWKKKNTNLASEGSPNVSSAPNLVPRGNCSKETPKKGLH